MKFKYYLRGAGVGIIATTILLTIAFFRYKPVLSADDIREQARKLGMVEAEAVVSKSDETEEIKEESQEDNKEDKKDDGTNKENQEAEDSKKSEKESDKKDKDEKKKDKKDDSKSDDKESDDSKSDDKKSDDDKKEEPRRIRFVVSGGEYSDVICNHLKDKGLIRNAERYNRWLGRHGYDNKIQPGVYFIKEGSSYREIAEKL